MAGKASPTTLEGRALLKQHEQEPTKMHIIFDASNRPSLIYTTYVGAENNDPALVTELVYQAGNSTNVISRRELLGRWNATWDAAFTFDPAVDYDADGDGTV